MMKRWKVITCVLQIGVFLLYSEAMADVWAHGDSLSHASLDRVSEGHSAEYSHADPDHHHHHDGAESGIANGSGPAPQPAGSDDDSALTPCCSVGGGVCVMLMFEIVGIIGKPEVFPGYECTIDQLRDHFDSPLFHPPKALLS